MMMKEELSCLVVDDEKVSIHVLSHLIEKHPQLTLKHVCGNASDAAEYLGVEEIDIVFLDVEMPGDNGLSLIPMVSPEQVILISSNRDYALDGFNFKVLDFLLKPISSERFQQAIEKYAESGKEEEGIQEEEDHLFVKDKGLLKRVNFEDLYCCEALGDYIKLYTAKGKYTIHATMKKLISRLPEDKFMRVHRSFIVNLQDISLIEENTISVKELLVPIGKSYRKELQLKLNTL
ncbi:MAG: LytTR family DNA-binding domain-containing protein [Bacteroidota bacterium]